jgi:c-di-GMP-related signal transduction protein
LEKFLARQPIFDHNRNVYGYELLFRSGPENYFDNSHPDAAAASAADNLLLFGVERLTEGRRAFMNCTREFLVHDFPFVFPKDRVVIEVLETVQVDHETVAACQRLKQAGYLLALDDFKPSPAWEPLVPLADFIKVDLLLTSEDEQMHLARTFSSTNVRLVAEKVESYDEFQRTLSWGYTYFQGYFFSRPQMVTHHDVPAYKLNYLRVLQAVNQPQMDLHAISERIKEEASLSYRLLRYLNSPAFPFVVNVSSIPHGLSLLGERGTRKWVSLVAIACMGDEKPAELVMLPLMRARFCELLAPYAGLAKSANDLFLLGLLSAMDAILDMEMTDVLKEIAIREDIRKALLGEKNKLRAVFDLALKYEMGAWGTIGDDLGRLGIGEELIPALYLQAVDWARGILKGEEASRIESR